MKALFFLCASLCFCAPAGEIDLARRGEKPQHSIVIPAHAPPSQEYALRDIDLSFVTKDRFIAHGGSAKGLIPNTMPSIRKNMENGFG